MRLVKRCEFKFLYNESQQLAACFTSLDKSSSRRGSNDDGVNVHCRTDHRCQLGVC